MNTSVSLQNLYKFSVIPLIVVVAIFFAMTIAIVVIVMHRKKVPKKPQKAKSKVIPEHNVKNIPVIKKKFLGRLQEIESKYEKKQINLRKAYQQISECVRLFVFKATDISTQNFSLSEIKGLNIPGLYELIEEYYEPEFASKSVGDFEKAINKARRIINEWN